MGDIKGDLLARLDGTADLVEDLPQLPFVLTQRNWNWLNIQTGRQNCFEIREDLLLSILGQVDDHFLWIKEMTGGSRSILAFLPARSVQAEIGYQLFKELRVLLQMSPESFPIPAAAPAKLH